MNEDNKAKMIRSIMIAIGGLLVFYAVVFLFMSGAATGILYLVPIILGLSWIPIPFMIYGIWKEVKEIKELTKKNI